MIAAARSLLGRIARAIESPAPVVSAAGLEHMPPGGDIYRRLADELDTYLVDDFLSHWFPRCIDTRAGGFHQDFTENWRAKRASERLVVHQARQTWVCARVALHAPELAERFAGYALHGLQYLAGPMWDEEFGGPYFLLTADGRPQTDRGGEKHVCGATFMIFAAATVYQATRDERALGLARRTFEWMDGCAHDGENGGYFEALARDGSPLAEALQPGRYDEIGTPYGYKTVNTHIHILEALSALYRVDPTPHLRKRTEELVNLIRDRLTVSPGAMHIYFTTDWRPLPMHDSFGHAVEAAYLLIDAIAALGRDDCDETWRVARSIVDQALEWGWDHVHGGLWFAGQAAGPPFDRTKSWWVQAENLNALLLMHERYYDETDRYWNAFRSQLEFIFRRLVDRRYGGWRAQVSEDGKTVLADRDKASQWKASYHDGRALMNVIATLRRMAI
jgi:mannobiose 2-epimerase